MAGTTVRELLIKFGVDGEAVEAGLKGVEESVSSAKASFMGLITAAAAVTAALAAVGAAAVFQASHTAEAALEITRQAEALGMTTDEYQKLAFAFGEFGQEASGIGDVFNQLAGQQQQAASGSTQLADSFAAIGISSEALKALAPQDLFAAVAEGLAHTSDATQRVQIANQLLGGGLAAKLLPLLTLGKEGLEEFGDEAERLGVVMGTDALKASSALSVQLATLTAQGEALRNKIGIALTPAVSGLVEKLSGWLEANQDVIEQDIKVYAEKVAAAFEAAAAAIAAANAIVGGAEGWVRLAEVMALLASSVGVVYVAAQFLSLGSALWGAGTAAMAFLPVLTGIVEGLMMLGGVLSVAAEGGLAVFTAAIAAAAPAWLPWAAGIAAVAAVLAVWAAWLATAALVVQDFWVYLHGGDSVLGRLVERFKDGTGAMAGLAHVAIATGNVFKAVLSRMAQGWDIVSSAIGAAWEKASAFGAWISVTLAPEIEMISNAVGAMLDVAAGGIEAFAQYIGTNPADAKAAPAGTETAAGGGVTGAKVAASASAGATAAKTTGNAAAKYVGNVSGMGGTTQKSVTVGGNQLTVNGAGMTLEQVQALYQQMEQQKQRTVADALAGGEL